MQIGLPFDAEAAASAPIRSAPAGETTPSPALEAPPKVGGDASLASLMYFVRHRRARRYLLRIDPDGRVRVTIPRGGSRKEATAFAHRQREWITQQRARLTISTITAEERRVHR